MQDYEFTIPAGAERPISARGNFLKLKSTTAEVRVRAEDDSGRIVTALDMKAGISITLPKEFVRIRVTNDTGNEVKVVFIAGMGDLQDSELTGTITASTGTTINADNEAVGLSATEIVSSNSARRSMVILNNSNTDIYIGHSSSVTTGNGFKIEAGQAITFDKSAQAAIYAIALSAALDVRIMQELD